MNRGTRIDVSISNEELNRAKLVEADYSNIKSASDIAKETAEFHQNSKNRGLDLNNWADFELDAIIPGDMITLLGGTGTGKTYMGLSICKATNDPILLCEMELSEITIGNRMIAMANGISVRRAIDAMRNKEGLNYNIFPNLDIETSANVTPEIVNRNIGLYQKKHGHRPLVVMVDYFQLISCGMGNAFMDTTKAARTFKTIAKDRNVIMVLLSQVSRDAQRRNGEIDLNDAKQSGQIEESSSLVLGLNRLNKSNGVNKSPALREWENENTDYNTKYYIKVLKNSHGPFGKKVFFEFDWSTTSFYQCKGL